LNTDVGSMQGWYIMHRLLDGQEIQVDIPKFQLVVPYRLN
jgi:ApaG protein